jgi:hypothetical protein
MYYRYMGFWLMYYKNSLAESDSNLIMDVI